MHLDSANEKLLRGEGGEARQLAMEILAKVGDAAGAESLVPIKSAHVQAARARALGHVVGKGSASRVPALDGAPKGVTSDDFKHLGAAEASVGPLSMIHYVGVTGGSSSLEEAAGGEKIERIDVSRSDLEAVEGELNQTEEAPDLVALGAPHLSVSELGLFARLLEGRKVKRGIELCAYTSRQAYEMASRAGIRADIEAAGGMLSQGTDADVSPLKAMGFHVVMTNSALLVETLLADGTVKVRYASLRDIIEEVSV